MSERGLGLLRYRYADPRRGDDNWTWTPGTRRLRRLNEALNDSATSGANTFDPDHFSGFNPKTEEYNYKFLGEKEMLAVLHAKNSPEATCPYDGGASACPEDWEIRHMYVVEATPDRSRTGDVLDKSNIIYTDSEAWYEAYVDAYDQKGALWRVNINWLTSRDRPVADARVAIYPFNREFFVGAGRYDVQTGVGTMCYFPGPHSPERECWYINMGAVDKDFFVPEAMVRAAP